MPAVLSRAGAKVTIITMIYVDWA